MLPRCLVHQFQHKIVLTALQAFYLSQLPVLWVNHMGKNWSWPFRQGVKQLLNHTSTMPRQGNLPFLCHFKQQNHFCSSRSASGSEHYGSDGGSCPSSAVLWVFIYSGFIFVPLWLISTSWGWAVIPWRLWHLDRWRAGAGRARTLLQDNSDWAETDKKLDFHTLLATTVLLFQLQHHKFAHFFGRPNIAQT